MKWKSKFIKIIFILGICKLAGFLHIFNFGYFIGAACIFGFLSFALLLFILFIIYGIRLLWLLIVKKGKLTVINIEEVSEFNLAIKDLNMFCLLCIVLGNWQVGFNNFDINTYFILWLALPQLFWWKEIRENPWWSFFICVFLLCEMLVFFMLEGAKTY